MNGAEAPRVVRFVPPDEPADELIEDAKSRTYEHVREHAVLEIADGRRVMVCGGPFGISLGVRRSTGPVGREGDELVVDIDGQPVVVRRLVFHTHPKPTGPSDGDFAVLNILGQRSSMLYELSGPRDGTEFGRKERQVRRE